MKIRLTYKPLLLGIANTTKMHPATLAQALPLLQQIVGQNPSVSDINAMNGFLADLARSAIEGSLPGRARFQSLLGLLPTNQVITVHYNRTLQSMADEAGFRSKDSGMTYHVFANSVAAVPESEESINYEFDLVQARSPDYLNGKVSKLEAFKAIYSDGRDKGVHHWHPAGVEHLLRMAKFFPKLQLKYDIVALGTVANSVDGGDTDRVPVLGKYRESKEEQWTRTFTDVCHSHYWPEGTRFLRVRRCLPARI